MPRGDMYNTKQIVASTLVRQLIVCDEQEAKNLLLKLLDHVESDFIYALEIAYQFSPELSEIPTDMREGE